MKTFTKKRGFFAAAAALLAVTAMLVTMGCSNDIGNNADDFSLPHGKGAVRLSFNENTTRTILPGGTTTLATFDKFDFQFTTTDSSGTTTGTIITKTVDQGDENNPIILDPGFYKLTVFAKISISSVMETVAKNDSPVFIEIVAAKTTSETITLKPIATGTGTGTFKYNITDSTDDDIVAATMTITQIGGSLFGSRDIFAEDELDGNDYTLPVTVGYYYVDFEIEVGSGSIVTFRQVVHIYQNMTSAHNFVITSNYFYGVLQEDSLDLTYEGLSEHKPTITYVITGTNPSSGSYSGTKISVKQGDTITFTVSNSDIFVAGNYEWYCVDNTSLGATNICAITPTTKSGIFNIQRDYELTVVGKLTADSLFYSTVVEFEIIP